MENKQSINKQISIENLRAVAILLVVFGHSIILYSDSWNLYTTEIKCDVLNRIKMVIDIIQMPLFFSISGYVFCWTISRKDMKKIIVEKICRLLLPFVIFCFLWMLPIRLLLGYSGYQGKNIVKIILEIVWGSDNGHLWYLPTLFMCFVFYGMVLKLESGLCMKREAVLGLNIIIVVVLYITRPLSGQPYLSNFYDYGAYFYLGYLINQNRGLVNTTNKIIKWKLLLLSIMMIFICLLLSNRYLTEIARIVALIVAYTFASDKENKLLSYISKNSFGVYLFHSPLIYITYTYLNNTSPIIVVLVNFCGFGFCALGLTMLLRKNSVLRKFIGEK